MMTTHNRLFSFNPDTKETKLVFTDEHTPIILTLPTFEEGEYGRKVFVSSKKSVFAPARERSRSERPTIYELSVDGSNRFRKVLALEDIKDDPLTQVFVNSSGTLLGYVSYRDAGPEGPTISVHEARTGALVRRMNLRKTLLNTYAMSIGWMPDDNRLYFTLHAAPHAPEEADRKVGTYMINAAGIGLVRLPPSLFAFPKPQGFTTVHSVGVAPDCVVVQPDGTLLMRELYSKGGLHSFLYLVNPATKSKKAVPLSRSEKIDWFRLSHNGKRVAFMQVHRTPLQPQQPYYIWTADIWVKDLESGAEQRVGSFRTRMADYYWPTLVGWLE